MGTKANTEPPFLGSKRPEERTPKGEELRRFEQLAKGLVAVPKQEVSEPPKPRSRSSRSTRRK
jgi:hypothetical protein